MSEGVYLLVIAPHPDDSEFGIGGSVAKLTKEGKKVVYVICTNGDKGTSDRTIDPADLVVTRRKEEQAAADVLGVSEVVFLGYPDQGIEDTPEFRKELVRLIRKYQPELVASCDPYRKYTWHRDHRITGQVVADAVFPFARDHLAYPDLLEQGYEPWKVKEMWFWGTDDINHCVDVTDTFKTKLEALRCHKSQVGDVPPEMEKRLREWATMNAKDEPFVLGEAFHRVEMRR
jgi:LmbE family N-acetylglucosaminyl deacetylase